MKFVYLPQALSPNFVFIQFACRAKKTLKPSLVAGFFYVQYRNVKNFVNNVEK